MAGEVENALIDMPFFLNKTKCYGLLLMLIIDRPF